MRRGAALLGALACAASAHAQMECRTDPKSADLEFALSAAARALEFRK